MTRRVILILGCHRSGTSVVARAMQCLGASFPSDLMPASRENPTGYWESAKVQHLNDHILRRCGGTTWDQPLEPERLAGLRLGMETDYAVAWLAEQPPLLALKDPRMCRLLPFWRPVFAAAEVEVSVVHVLRHPMAVAQSLRKRGISVERGLALWLEHVVRAREDVDPRWPQAQVDFRNFVESYGCEDEMHMVSGRLGISMDLNELSSFNSEFVRSDLMHENIEDKANQNLPFLVWAVWEFVQWNPEYA